MSTITICNNPITYFIKYLKDYKTANNITDSGVFETAVNTILTTGVTIPNSLNKNLCCPDCPSNCDNGTYVLASVSDFITFVNDMGYNDPKGSETAPCCTNYFASVSTYASLRAAMLCTVPSCCTKFTTECIQKVQTYLVETEGTTETTYQTLLTNGIVENSTISGNSQLCTLIDELNAQLPGVFGFKVWKAITDNGLVISCNQVTPNSITFSNLSTYLNAI